MALAHLREQKPAWLPVGAEAMTEALHLFGLGKAEECEKVLGAAPDTERKRILSSLNKAVLSGKWPEGKALAGSVESLVKEGLVGEALWIVQSALLMTLNGKGPAGAEALAREFLKMDEKKLGPILRNKVELSLAQIALKADRGPEILDWLLLGIRHGTGRRPVADEIQWEFVAVHQSLKLGRHESSVLLLERILKKLAVFRGWQDPMVFSYQAQLVASKVLAGRAPKLEELKALQTAGASIQGAEHALKFLQAIEMALSLGEDAKPLCAEFIKGLVAAG
mgnify:CR=1 FL=1